MVHKITKYSISNLTRIVDISDSKFASNICHPIEDGYKSLGPFSRDGVSDDLQLYEICF